MVFFFFFSFKERGARNALLLLNNEQKSRGVISASLGNHAQGLSYHAFLLGIPCTVVMPSAAPIMKIQKCRSYGATVLVHVSSSYISFRLKMLIYLSHLNRAMIWLKQN